MLQLLDEVQRPVLECASHLAQVAVLAALRLLRNQLPAHEHEHILQNELLADGGEASTH